MGLEGREEGEEEEEGEGIEKGVGGKERGCERSLQCGFAAAAATCGLAWPGLFSQYLGGSLVGLLDSVFVDISFLVDAVQLSVLRVYLVAHVRGHVLQIGDHPAHRVHVLLHFIFTRVVRYSATILLLLHRVKFENWFNFIIINSRIAIKMNIFFQTAKYRCFSPETSSNMELGEHSFFLTPF